MNARINFRFLLALSALALAALACMSSSEPSRQGDIDTLMVQAADGWQASGIRSAGRRPADHPLPEREVVPLARAVV